MGVVKAQGGAGAGIEASLTGHEAISRGCSTHSMQGREGRPLLCLQSGAPSAFCLAEGGARWARKGAEGHRSPGQLLLQIAVVTLFKDMLSWMSHSEGGSCRLGCSCNILFPLVPASMPVRQLEWSQLWCGLVG